MVVVVPTVYDVSAQGQLAINVRRNQPQRRGDRWSARWSRVRRRTPAYYYPAAVCFVVPAHGV